MSARASLKRAIALAKQQSEKAPIEKLIQDLDIARIEIGLPKRTYLDKETPLTQPGNAAAIHTKLDMIIAKLDEQKGQTSKIVPAVPQIAKILANQTDQASAQKNPREPRLPPTEPRQNTANTAEPLWSQKAKNPENQE